MTENGIFMTKIIRALEIQLTLDFIFDFIKRKIASMPTATDVAARFSQSPFSPIGHKTTINIKGKINADVNDKMVAYLDISIALKNP